MKCPGKWKTEAWLSRMNLQGSRRKNYRHFCRNCLLYEEAHRRARTQQRRDRRAAEQHLQCAHNGLLGDKAGDERGRDAPVAEAHRAENRGDNARNHRENALRGVLNEGEAQVERLKEPDDERCEENDRERTLEEVLRLVPEQLADVFRARQTVVRQLHDERNRLAAEHRAAQEQRHQQSHEDAAEVKRGHDERTVFREKCGGEKGIDRQFGRAAHERRPFSVI